MTPEEAKVGVWYLVITMYGWDQTEGLPVRTIIRRLRHRDDARPGSGRVLAVLRREGFEAASVWASTHTGPWEYRCKAYRAKRVDTRSPLGRLGSTMWSYAARPLPPR